MAKQERVRIRLVKSTIGVSEKLRKTVRALGLRKLNSSVVQENNPQIQGMISRVQHLIQVERVKK
jgi:large subunit ribosomal protein L30